RFGNVPSTRDSAYGLDCPQYALPLASRARGTEPGRTQHPSPACPTPLVKLQNQSIGRVGKIGSSARICMPAASTTQSSPSMKTGSPKAHAVELPSRMGRPTEAEARIKKDQLLGVAQELFVRLGYSAVSMRQVAEKAQVSTRTLYNHYADKASLFAACLDFGAAGFPDLQISGGADLRTALRDYAAKLVRTLSQDGSFQLGMLIYREGGDFPELLRASEANYER